MSSRVAPVIAGRVSCRHAPAGQGNERNDEGDHPANDGASPRRRERARRIRARKARRPGPERGEAARSADERHDAPATEATRPRGPTPPRACPAAAPPSPCERRPTAANPIQLRQIEHDRERRRGAGRRSAARAPTRRPRALADGPLAPPPRASASPTRRWRCPFTKNVGVHAERCWAQRSSVSLARSSPRSRCGGARVRCALASRLSPVAYSKQVGRPQRVLVFEQGGHCCISQNRPACRRPRTPRQRAAPSECTFRTGQVPETWRMSSPGSASDGSRSSGSARPQWDTPIRRTRRS